MDNQYTVRFDRVPGERHDRDDEYFSTLRDAESCGLYDDVYIYAPGETPDIHKPLQRWENGERVK